MEVREMPDAVIEEEQEADQSVVFHMAPELEEEMAIANAGRGSVKSPSGKSRRSGTLQPSHLRLQASRTTSPKLSDPTTANNTTPGGHVFSDIELADTHIDGDTNATADTGEVRMATSDA